MDIFKSATKKLLIVSLITLTQISHAEFKRFSISAGWLHVMPQGNANPFNINTAVANGTNSTVGAISPNGFLNALDPSAKVPDTDQTYKDTLTQLINMPGLEELLKDENGNVKPEITGSATVNDLDRWESRGTGLEADDVDTLGLMFNYYINDNVSLQLIGGIPPKVDIKGKGEIFAPMSGMAHTGIGLDIPLLQDIPITTLGNKSKAATVRAWTPALEAQYQFGKSGVNKFRPYIGAGLMYSHFSNIKLNGQIKADLISAGHMIQNVLDGQAGAALDGKSSNANPFVRVKTTDAIAPIISLGATYDFTSNWYAVASVSYAKLNNRANIDVIDSKTGKQLIHASTKVDIDPLITYLGVGYRF
ncbi:OmpW/AlkL family protein [Acinetobacter stercoris]|uniref:Outer membrane protein W n=1 Tax=Acinetobacter stercoris TaxID=2126983 RepID=A0A2U3N4K9_9GAMM|nr:OmpW family outer membrane protein [Acinetobacter stercoris]SPL72640.1 outer membrane protein W [Acinetobacter stercoris]